MKYELCRLQYAHNAALWNLTGRYHAVDANNFLDHPDKDEDIDPWYTLSDQLFVEPQPLALPSTVILESRIQMSLPEIAVARSHIAVWRQVAISNFKYVLILEDDIWFRANFAKQINQAWAEVMGENESENPFDILYVSYEEVKGGAPKTFISRNVFRPDRGLWHFSGYIISREGAKRLLQLLPCRGPIDLWINHQFNFLKVRAVRESIIMQRRDVKSSNLYSVLPSLTKIGAINSEQSSLFQLRIKEQPVFVFGPDGSGLSSVAMALLMLGYRCCSDLDNLPAKELQLLRSGSQGRIFNAYVNIGCLEHHVVLLKQTYPRAKFIVTAKGVLGESHSQVNLIRALNGASTACLDIEDLNKWGVLCKHLNCAPSSGSFPDIRDIGKRQLHSGNRELALSSLTTNEKRDSSPWVIPSSRSWNGIHFSSYKKDDSLLPIEMKNVSDSLEFLNENYWYSRDDTFTDNLALFRPYNVGFRTGSGATLSLQSENMGVRNYSAAALTSKVRYLYGRFEAIIKASNVPGVVTGFFLHRDSPRQEIDIEITGNRTSRMLVNVYYNPGNEGARFDYGYRGAAASIALGFDASDSYHTYAIEWSPSDIQWFVDGRLVHRRVEWDPTPIPNLAMAIHVNIWACKSRELAGRLKNSTLPATSFVEYIAIHTNNLQTTSLKDENSLLQPRT